MRIIAGSARGRRLRAPTGAATRPTADRVRESVFNILGQFSEGDCVLDLYAGSGALGLEALSRGAARACFVDRDRRAAECIRGNAEALGFAAAVEVLVLPASRAIRRLAEKSRHFDTVFVDPPYAGEGARSTLDQLADATLLATGAIVVVEHDRRVELPDQSGHLARTDLRTYGDTTVSFYEKVSP